MQEVSLIHMHWDLSTERVLEFPVASFLYCPGPELRQGKNWPLIPSYGKWTLR